MTLSCDGEPRLVPLGASLEHVNAIPFSGGIDEGDGAVIAAVVAGVAD
ncbi:hypothetical protein [Microbacterium amylolyticum]|uniref:Uncharacterized protein n=2 Tax=Microbacterium amylolyticum TaxID=936337 RepID=A0ABS4ZEX6_9MICO|nr:hypothetical protein [Microbacterium amylolyticum]MBP2435588.1 hypothetical protein [Microbacterium amylolyticum]